jgi:hypothetical protein
MHENDRHSPLKRLVSHHSSDTFFIMISAAVLLSLVSATSLVSFNPPKLDLDDHKVAKFQIKFNRKPTAPVQVYLEGRGVEFSTCQLEIDENNYQRTHEIVLNGVPVFDQRDPSKIPVRVRVYEGDKEMNETYEIVRKPLPGGTCTSVGDPHYKTFDGHALDFQGKGAYHFFTSQDLEIQTTQTICFGKKEGPSCNQAVAIRYGSTVMALDVRQGGDLRRITPNTNAIQYTPPKKDDVTHIITLPCGSKINMIVHTSDSYKWIDLTLNAAGGYSNNGGMCNRLGNKDGRLYAKSGPLPIAQHPDFFESWKVSDPENLLLGNYRLTEPDRSVPVSKCVLPTGPKPKPSPSPVVTLPAYVPVITTSVAPAPATSSVPAVAPSPSAVTSVQTSVAASSSAAPAPASSSTAAQSSPAAAVSSSSAAATVSSPAAAVPSTSVAAAPSTSAYVEPPAQITTVPLQSTAVRPQPTTVPPPPQEYKDQVENHCKQLFKEDCAAVVDKKFYVQACIKDAILLGSLAYSETTKTQYLAQCKTKTDYMREDVSDQVKQKAEEIQSKAGLGTNQCTNNCSGNGICGNNGCRCKPGFGGSDCSVDLTKMMSYDQEKQKYTPSTPKTVYPVVGSLPASDQAVDALPKPADATTGPIVSSATSFGISFGILLLSLM